MKLEQIALHFIQISVITCKFKSYLNDPELGSTTFHTHCLFLHDQS